MIRIKRNILKKTLVFTMLAFSTSLIQLPAFADDSNFSSPEETVSNYLEAVKDENFDKAVSILRESDLTKSEQKEELKEIMADKTTKIVEVKNVNLLDETDDYVKLTMVAQYEDGNVSVSPVLLKKEANDKYLLERVSEDEFENLDKESEDNQGFFKENTNNTTTDSQVNISVKKANTKSYSQTQLVNWNFNVGSDQIGAKKYTDTFSVSNISYLRANVSTKADVELAVVKKGVTSDTVLTDSSTLDADEDSQRTNLHISSGNSVSNAKLRIIFLSDGNCYGELYAIKS